MNSSGPRVVLGCLIGLALALLLVGIVSGTVLRHVIQTMPIVIAAGVLTQRPAWGAYAALPIFVFWIFITVMIWLFLLGLSRVASGHYTTIEVVSTCVMAACSSIGAVRSIAVGRPLSIGSRVISFAAMAVVQVAAMWVSFLRLVANR